MLTISVSARRKHCRLLIAALYLYISGESAMKQSKSKKLSVIYPLIQHISTRDMLTMDQDSVKPAFKNVKASGTCCEAAGRAI